MIATSQASISDTETLTSSSKCPLYASEFKPGTFGYKSDKLVIGLDVQVSPNDLLTVRSEPFVGGVLGHIAPLAVIYIIDGPRCAGGAVWWKVWGQRTGWAVENSLRACPKEGECNPWRDEQLQP